jgi:DNA-binding NarL/FixJ family response regulator
VTQNVSKTVKLRVLIVDDHPLVLQGLRTMLLEAGGIDVVAQATNAAAAITAVRQTQLDLVVSAMALPDKSGLVLLKLIKTEQPQLPVLMLSMHAEAVFAVRARKLGAAGYVMKDVDADTLVGAIRQAASGGKYISPDVGERLANQTGPAAKGALHGKLSRHEFKVFCLIAAGKGHTEIGLALQVGTRAISSAHARIVKKTGLRTRADFTRYALAHNLID